jgi:hypothetical protein
MKKKTTRQHVSNPKPLPKRVLRLSHETVRMLNADELARAGAGGPGAICVTTSWTTESGGTC